MNKVYLLFTRYWYVLLITILLSLSITEYVNIMLKPSFTTFKVIAQTAVGSKTSRRIVKWAAQEKSELSPLQKYSYLFSSNGSLYLEEISTKDSVFTKLNPRQGEISYLLFNDPSIHKGFIDFSFGELSYKEMEQLIGYYAQNKHRLDFWSAHFKDTQKILTRYHKQLEKPELKLTLIHRAGEDSSLVFTYRPSSLLNQVNLGGVYAKDISISQVLLQNGASLSTLILVIFLLVVLVAFLIWRAIVIVGKIGWLELAFILLVLFPYDLISKSLFWSNLFGGISTKLVFLFLMGLVFVTPRPLSTKPLWRYLFYFLILLMIWERSSFGFMYFIFGISIFVLFVIQLLRQKGLQRRIMGRWFSLGFLPLLILAAEIFGLALALKWIIEPLFKVSGLSGSWLYHQGLLYGLTLDLVFTSLFFLFIFVPIVSPFVGLLLGLLEFPIRYYYRMRKWLSGFVVFGAYVVVLHSHIYFNDKTISHNFFVLFFLFAVGIALAMVAMRFFRFLDPVHHDERKALKSLLESSFNHQEESEYFSFYAAFIKKLYPKTKLALIREESSLGLEQFNPPTPEMLSVIPTEGYFNLDLARIDRDPASKAFPEWIPPKRRKQKKSAVLETEDTSKQSEVRLYYPLTDSQSMAIGYLYFGESGKLYWDKENADFIAETVQIFNSFLNNINLNTSYREEQIKLERERTERILNEQLAAEREIRNQELQEFNLKIMDSINYASLIQRSILPNTKVLNSYLKEYFIIWKPRDVVGGDYYWFYPIPEQDSYLLAVIDCTGHGVPGAFMTLMTNSILNSIVRDRKIYSPDEIISQLHHEVRYTLQQGHAESMKDGLDISLILVDKAKQQVSFSGAKHRMLYFNQLNSEPVVRTLVGYKHSLGGSRENLQPELEILNYHSGDMLYLLTDGLIDQPVQQAELLKRRLWVNWIEYFRSNANQSLSEQKSGLESFIETQLTLHEQRDDITLMGILL
ncbi:MAG: SpoIIE family protein phosphatase [Candidatus Cloacimonetes bacterium]|nr:SpoIIE family protein phosphatase [Candidatus Cloacimonadota bacterium]